MTYIKGSPSKDLLYNGHLQIEAFSESNYAGDKRDRNLLLAIALMLEAIWLLGGVKCSIMFCFGAEVEYRAMAHTAYEMMWLKSLL